MRVAYFTNQYPAVSHTFIRREIEALERLGVSVVRVALRPAAGKVIHDPDQAELQNTRYILKASVGEFVYCVIKSLLQKPVVTIEALWLALRIGWRSDRGLLRHLMYTAEAMVLAEWCQRDAVTHVHAHFGTNPAAIAMLAAHLSKVPYSFTAHGSEEFEKAPLLSLDVKLGRAAFAICVSSFGRAQLMRWSPVELWDKIHVVHCGIDDSFLAHTPTVSPTAPRFVCVGRLGEHKAQLVLVEAVRKLRDAGIHCELVLAGDGPMRRQVEAEISRKGLEREITITGWVTSERVKSEVLAARALILPSFSENMPVVIMEALSLGRPVISTYIAGIPELVRPGESGWLVPSSDSAALAAAMREALAAPVSQLAAMGAAGRAHVLMHHDAMKEAQKLKNLFTTSLTLFDKVAQTDGIVDLNDDKGV